MGGTVVLRGMVKLFVALNSKKGVGEVAAGAACGLLLALIPSGNLLWVTLLLATYFLKVNFAVELLFMGLFKLFIPLADPALDSIGLLALKFSLLEDAYTAAYNMPALPFTRFNNTIVMGGLFAGVVLWFPAYLLFRFLATLYRRKVKEKLEQTKFYKWLKGLPIVSHVARLAAGAGRVTGGGR